MSYTLYFQSGETYTQDYPALTEAHLAGLKMAREKNLTYQYCEKTEYNKVAGMAHTTKYYADGTTESFSWATR